MLNKNDLKNTALLSKKYIFFFNMKAVFIKEFNDRVSDFLEESPNSTMENIIENFRTPEPISKSISGRFHIKRSTYSTPFY